jgi:putative ABC transport system permease protein
MHDVRYAVRLLVRQPLFASLVIGTLALGITAATSMFAVVNGVLLKPLPYADPATLVWMFGAFRASDSAAVSPPDFVDYRSRTTTFERVAAMAISPSAVTLAGSGAPERLQASRVSAQLMTTLGVAPVMGRDFTAADEKGGSAAVIVSDRLWDERFARAADVVGRSIIIDGRAHTIVGVMPRGFTLPYDSFIRLTDPVDLYLPIALDDADAQVRRFHSLRLIGRRRADTSLRRAQADMDVIARQLAAAYPENDTWHLRLVPLHERIVGGVRPVLLILTAAVVLLLLVSCANVASLLLARASARQHELAVRGALGASRARLIRQLLVEGFVLSLAAGSAALVATLWVVRAITRIGPGQFPRLDAVEVEPRVVAFALAAAAGTTLLFALAPAIHAACGSLAAAIGPARTATGDRSRRLGQRALVVGQLAVSVVLLAAAALLVRGFVRVVKTDLGFAPANVLLTRVPLPEDRYDTAAKIDQFYTTLLERLAASPGIEAAALATAPPLAGANDTLVYRPGQRPSAAADRRFAQIRWVRGDYFGALRIPLVDGRRFDDQLDRAGAPLVAVIGQRMAREHFGAESAVGQRVVIDLGEPVTAEVVGVVGDVRVFGQASEPPPMLYVEARQRPMAYLQAVLRSPAPIGDVAATVRRELAALDATLAPSRIDRMDDLVADSVAQPRFAMLLIATFAVLAVVLTLVGLYGTIAYLVAQRRREIGIRLAVGATPGDIRRMVFGQGALLAAAGISIGLAASVFASRVASTFLTELQSLDPVVAGCVAAISGITSIAAVLVPAQRAAAIEPLLALRSE